MDTEKLKSIVDKAQQAVKDVKDESLKKIAFQKILDVLLITGQTAAPTHTAQYGQREVSHASTLITTSQGNLSEFFSEKGPKSHPDITLTFAYYFHYKGDGDFNVEDIIQAYKKVLVPPPKNPTDIINQNIRKGFLNKQDKQKDSKQAYHITKYGIEFIDNNFSGKSKAVYVKKKKDKNEH